MKIRVATLLALLVLGGCTNKEPQGPGAIVSLETDVLGLSGLSRDEHGALWAPGERADAVLRIDPTNGSITRYPVIGAPEGVDLEALTWIEGTRFVVGTETQERGRTRDVILDGRLDGRRFVVRPMGHLEYTLWRMVAPGNDGIEGVCQADRVLVFATELVEKEGGSRFAPIGVFDPSTQGWTAHRLGLTTNEGKLAALDCRFVDGTIEALAVERHFGVSRLLRFRLPLGPEPQTIEPTVSADLSKLVEPVPNFEGLAWLGDGSVVLLTDNRYRGPVTEPSRLYFIPAGNLR